MNRLSSKVTELWRQNSFDDYDIYLECLYEYKNAHNKKNLTQWLLAIALFGGGIFMLLIDQYITAVITFVLAGYFQLNSNNHNLVTELMSLQELQSKLINHQNHELKKIQTELNDINEALKS